MEMALDWRSVGSLIATVMVFRTALRDFLPPEAEQFVRRLIARVAAAFRGPKATILIDEADGAGGGANDLYDAAQLYLGARCLATAPAVRLHKPRQAQHPVASLPDAHNTHDTFRGVRVKWTSTARAWKRGYLLHGPPGTGKTSLVAAIANLLEFDVYDLELTTVPTNSHLRRLLVSTTPKSVVVVEDIDCSLDLSDRQKKGGANTSDEEKAKLSLLSPTAAAMAAVGRESISLSGVLNFVDGLWSSCVGERLMVFTTNHPERLDQALLRPGRMDRKIELGYCSPAALRVLAKNYLGAGDEGSEDPNDDPDTVNDLMAEAEGLLAAGLRITPADIAEVFMGCDGAGATAALTKLVDELRKRDAPAAATATDGSPLQLATHQKS